jgi:hypothetical protein
VHGSGHFARSHESGDGSGTGTGGTFEIPDGTPLRMWKGWWAPALDHFSSNYKEMMTLKLSLLQLSLLQLLDTRVQLPCVAPPSFILLTTVQPIGLLRQGRLPARAAPAHRRNSPPGT